MSNSGNPAPRARILTGVNQIGSGLSWIGGCADLSDADADNIAQSAIGLAVGQVEQRPDEGERRSGLVQAADRLRQRPPGWADGRPPFVAADVRGAVVGLHAGDHSELGEPG